MQQIPLSSTSALMSNADKDKNNEGDKKQTLLTPVTSNETREAIKALLMLGDAPSADSQMAPDDNTLLVPITGGTAANIPPPPDEQTNDTNTEPADEPSIPNDVPDLNEEGGTPMFPQQTPLTRTVLGMAVKTDMDDTNCNAIKQEPTPKKELSFKQYGIKRKYKSTHKFMCQICSIELPSVQEFNQHYLDKHPPLPCPDCTRMFSSPCTLAKYWYMHAKFMYECQDCGRGFTCKSQLESHHRVHLKMAGLVCFKPKCGCHFKRESELNAHLVTHDKKYIKCNHCEYSNPDIRKVCVHSDIHSDKLPFHCPLCHKGFKWQRRGHQCD